MSFDEHCAAINCKLERQHVPEQAPRHVLMLLCSAKNLLQLLALES